MFDNEVHIIKSKDSFNHLVRIDAHESIRTFEMHHILNKNIFVTFGNGSYAGSIFCRPDRTCQHIFVGNYSSLSDDIKFMIGANHEFDFATSYPIGWLFGCNKEVKSGDFKNVVNNMHL